MPIITQVNQFSNEQLVSLKELARLEIEAMLIPNAITRSIQLNEVSQKLEEFMRQSKSDMRLYAQIRLEVWENLKLKRQTDGELLLRQEEALDFELQTLSKYGKKNLAEVLFQFFQVQDQSIVETILTNPLLFRHINIKYRDSLGYSLLHAAIARVPNSQLEVLLKLGADPNAEQWSFTHEEILHKAARFRDVSTLELLLKYGAKIDLRDKQEKTPLFIAKTAENMKFFLKNGAEAKARNKNGETPLHYVLWFSAVQTQLKIKLLLQYGADMNAKNNEGLTALHAALENLSLDLTLLDFLKQNGADIEAKDNEGRTPLIYLVEKVFKKKDADRILIMEALLKNDANINAQNNDGKTALHSAVSQENLEFVEVLIKNGVDVNVRDNRGKTPLRYVGISSAGVKIKDLLLRNGAVE